MREYIATVVADHGEALDVVYEAPGFEPVTVGVIKPLVGESLDDLIAAAAPTATWDWEARKRLPKQEVALGKRVIVGEAAPAAEPEAEQPRVRLGSTEVLL